MREKDLKQILQQTYSFDRWKELMPLFFKKVEYLSKPQAFALADDRIKKGEQIGRIKLDDDKSLAIFEVEVSDNVVIARNRKELRDIAIKHIDQDITHGAIVFFHSPNQKDYRFSFIAKWSALDMETGEFIKGETKPKRYTYLLGPNEACTTAAKRLLTLIPKKEEGKATIKELQEVFSVEALNREFFKSYKAHYEKFWKYLAESPWRDELIDAEKEDINQQEKPIRDFVKKLLGRIVFLHFLQKKGWMGCSSQSNEWLDGEKRFMQLLFEEFTDKEHFHSQCLTKLFFETLNTKRSKGEFHIEGLEGNLNGSHVPYLNGGLFEPEKNKATLKIDFPAQYFEELLDFFEQYNFTIDENSPDDHEVGIDPEMLGHIFENLLEENREKGAFYTPKEIVQYMCQESLIQYLYNHFGKRQDIDDFIRHHTVSPFLAERDNASKLNQLLDDIKVCDPAIGSGAFPIGMLQEIFDAKRFIYPFLKTNQPFDPAAVKKNIIQNSIYGVDIEKGAVDIAQLRFWLALVVEEVNPHPLPNLDYKIMQGNSLLEQYEGIDLSKTAMMDPPTERNVTLFEEPNTPYGFSQENRDSIKQLVKAYFKEEDKDEKARIHRAIDRIVLDHIDKSLEGFENQLLIEIADAKQALKRKQELKQKTSKIEKEIAQRQELLENKGKARQNLLKFEESDERPYFLWHLYFMDVFEQGGFDVMIGNPPYIQIQKMNEVDKLALEEAKYKTYTRTGDIYCLFYEKGLDLLKERGILTYITSNTWMRTKFGDKLRGFFVTKFNPEILLNFEDTQIFPSATVEVNILIGKNDTWNKKLEAVAVKSDFKNGDSIYTYLNKNKIQLSDLSNESWVILSKSDYEIKNKIALKGLPLKEWDLQFYRGFLTGFNDAFFIDEEKKEELIKKDYKSKEIIKPLLRGREIKKYSYTYNAKYVIFTRREFPIEDYTSIQEHLSLYRKKLEPKPIEWDDKKDGKWQGRKPGNYLWYEFQDNIAYYPIFNKEKLIWLSISDKPAFALDRNKMYVTAPAYIMTSHCNKYLMVVLNSRTMEWYLDKISSSTGVGTNQWSKIFVEKLPIPELDEETKEPFELIAEYLIFLNDPKSEQVLEKVNNEAIRPVFEDLANMMVYELYFEEEMKDKELNVLQFINEKTFPDITDMSPEEKKATIQKVYYELQQKDNPIRNRILVSESRSEIIRRINEVTNS